MHEFFVERIWAMIFTTCGNEAGIEQLIMNYFNYVESYMKLTVNSLTDLFTHQSNEKLKTESSVLR